MRKKLKDFIIGPALENSQLEGEKLRILWGLPIYSSDTISSVAYAGEEVLLVLSQFTCEESWANTLHNQTSIQLKLQLNQRRNVTCISIPYIS